MALGIALLSSPAANADVILTYLKQAPVAGIAIPIAALGIAGIAIAQSFT